MATTNGYFYENKDARINTQIKLTDLQQFWRKHLYMRFQVMKDSRAIGGREEKWNGWQRQYEAWRPPRMDWQSTIVPPYTTSVVESALSELVDQTMQPMVQARKLEDVAKATTINFIKDYTWQIGDGDVELYKGLKQELVLGTTVWQEYYWRDQRSVKLIVKYDPKTGKEEYEEKIITDFDDCYGETVNLWDVWFDPNARSVNLGPYKAQDAIRRYIMHIDVFRHTFLNSKWDKFNLVDKIKPGGDTNYYQYYRPPQGVNPGSDIEVLWYWCRYPDTLVICANDIPFYIGPNPYNHKQLPFAVGSDIPDLWSIYGKGEPQLLESIQDELTTMRRMRIDRQKLDIYKMIFVSNRETLSDDDLIPAPMKPIYVEDPKNVKAFEYGDINPSAYREEAMLKEDGQRVTGIDDRAQSVQQSGSTATEAAILKEATMKRLRMKIWLNSRTLLMDQIRLRTANIQQFYKTPKITEIMGRSAIEKQLKIRDVAEQNRLLAVGGKFYEAEFRTIVTRNKQLKKTEDGGVEVLDKRGDNYFMVTPDLLTPSAQGWNFKLSAEPTLNLSKPLRQQKTGEFFQHPMISAAIQSGYYDLKKVADIMADVNDFDPDQLKTESTGEQQDQLLIDPKQMLEMASRENEQMANGEVLVGTPYSTPEHTQQHLAFMQSTAFKERATPEILQAFSKHILEENMAQIMRGQALGKQTQMLGAGAAPQEAGIGIRNKETAGIMEGDLKNINPNMQLGPENVPDATGSQVRYG